MKSIWRACVLLFGLAVLTVEMRALTPPVLRSTYYNGAYSNVVSYPAQSWMNTNTVLLTVESWIYCGDVTGVQTIIARHFSTNLFFGLSSNRLRFYRSGGTFADSDGTVVAGRWTHVAASYDGSNVRFYINGAAAGTKALSSAGNNCTNSLSLGGERDILNLGDVFAGGYSFNGYIDEVRLWSVVRSQSSIAANMNLEVRSGTGLLATFGSGGNQNDIRFESGTTTGIPVADRWSGFGILPATLCIPRTGNALKVDANIDLLNEYRGAETMVLRSTTSATTPDARAYLIVCTNATNYHLFVGVPDLFQVGTPQIPAVQLMCDVGPGGGNAPGLGDWQCAMSQDSFQGGQIYGTNPPFFPTPQWLSWGQSASNWQAITGGSFEFHQSYEFRIHARNLNYFTNSVGLLVRYYDYDAGGDQLVAPRSGVTNQPTTYAAVNWCGNADSDLRLVSIAGVVTNVTIGAGEGGWTVTLMSGLNPTGGDVIRTLPVFADGTFLISGYVPEELPFHLRLEFRSGYTVLTPEFTGSGKTPSSISGGNTTLTYSPCNGGPCGIQNVRFRVQSPAGPVSIATVLPATVPATVTVRTNPPKVTAAATVTINGTNLSSAVRVYFKGPSCVIDPPNFCTGDFIEATVVSNTFDRSFVVAAVPEIPGLGGVARSYQIVVENPGYLSTGGNRWNYGPNVTLVPPVYAQLHGFEFVNRDDGPSIEEFEACYGDSIFNIFRFREPYYAIWAAVYFAWMDGTHGSCYGMAGTSRLMADGFLPVGTYDTAGADGIHGVRFANGYLGTPLCDLAGELCPQKPGRWTGFDLFQPFRPINLWARITSFAGAQTSAEALAAWLSQLRRPAAFGPRRGFASSDPVEVLNRVRTTPNGYTVCMQKRDFGDGHCITPYAVVDGMGLDPTNAVTPIVAANSSLIKVYDNNWPSQERFIEVNRVDNTYRYNSGGSIGIYDGPGLFYVPMAVYRNARHAPDPFFLAQYGLDFLRILTVGASSASITATNGGQAGWTASGITNGYEGALPYLPFGLLRDSTNNQFDTTMFFLPATNPPVASTFRSGGSNVLVYAGMGWGDIAFGFRAPDTAGNNTVDGILIGLNQGLRGLGFHAGAAVTGFGAMIASRDAQGQSRVFILDAGAGQVLPDLQIERDGFASLIIRNRGASPIGFRLAIAGTDFKAGTFQRSYDLFNQPGHSTQTIRLPEDAAREGIVREIDTNNDGVPDSVEEAPANGQLRVNWEAGNLALRWRQFGMGGTLEEAATLNGQWQPSAKPVTTEGSDKVARFKVDASTEFYRVRAAATNCASLGSFAAGAQPNPWETNGFRFEAASSTGSLLAQNTIVTRDGYNGLDVAHTARVYPVEDSAVVDLEIYQTSGLVTLEAVGALDTVLSRQTLSGAGKAPQHVTLRSFNGGIRYVRIVSPNGLCEVIAVCSSRNPGP